MSSHTNERLTRHYEREAEAARSSLASSLNDINARLTPGQVFDEVLTYARTGGGTFTRAFSSAVRENPLPSLLIGTGLMMFLSERMGVMRPAGEYGRRRGYQTGEYEAPGLAEKAKEKVSEAGETVKQGIAAVGDSILDASQRAREKTQEMREGMSEAADEAKHRASQIRRRVSETAAHTTEQAMNAGRQVKDQAAALMHDQPMVVAGIGLALGAAIAALLPSTRVEDDLMGKTSDNVKKQLGDAASRQLETAKQAASELADTAKDVAEREGIASAADVVRRFGTRESGDGSTAETSQPPENRTGTGEDAYRKL